MPAGGDRRGADVLNPPGGLHPGDDGAHGGLEAARAGGRGCAVHEHEFLRGLGDADVGKQSFGVAGFTCAVLDLCHGDLAHRAADQHGHDDKQHPADDGGYPVARAPAAQ